MEVYDATLWISKRFNLDVWVHDGGYDVVVDWIAHLDYVHCLAIFARILNMYLVHESARYRPIAMRLSYLLLNLRYRYALLALL